MKEKINAVTRALLHAFSQNLGWKIFSLVAAILMWSYIISNDPTITRDKTLSVPGSEITTSGLAVLQSRDLALLTDPTTLVQDIRVRVEVPQANYSRVSNDSVRVELDLSQIRQTGRQEVELTGVSNFGEVVQLTPSKIEVVVETLDQRNIPVNTELTGYVRESRYWYNVEKINPSVISISGPSSIVRQITSARASLDVTGITDDYSWTVAPELLNSAGEVITQPISKSSSSITVSATICPVKQLKVASDVETCVNGTPADGMVVSRVEVQPEVVTVAAASELLTRLETITYAPVNVSGRSQSFSVTVYLNKLVDIKHLSSEQVTVTVYIEEETITRTFRNVPLSVNGEAEGQKAELSQNSVTLTVTGPKSAVEALNLSDIEASVDVAGQTNGVFSVPVTAVIAENPDLVIELETQSVTATVK